MGRRTTLAGVLTTVVLASGCAGTSRGEPTPAEDTAAPESSTTSSAPENYGAPTVENPLDASPYLDNPCAVLSRAQLADFGVVRPGEAETDGAIAESIGPQCIWHAVPEMNSTIDVGFVIGDRLGLGALYAARDQQEYFEETTVQGYPAVFHSALDRRALGACNISVGISNTLSFRTSEYGVMDSARACARAKKVADAVVTTLKGVV